MMIQILLLNLNTNLFIQGLVAIRALSVNIHTKRKEGLRLIGSNSKNAVIRDLR